MHDTVRADPFSAITTHHYAAIAIFVYQMALATLLIQLQFLVILRCFCLTLKFLSLIFCQMQKLRDALQFAITTWQPLTLTLPYMYLLSPMFGTCSANNNFRNMCCKITECGHAILVATVDCSSQVLYERCTSTSKECSNILKNLE